MTFSSSPIRSRHLRSQPRRRRPSLEWLEDRLAPALYTVTTLADENDGLAVGGVSLREAIAAASTVSDADIIDFAVAGTINLASALPDVSGGLSIVGPGPGSLTVRRDVAAQFRIFNVAAGSDVEIAGLTIQNGRTSSGSGGGISSVDARLSVRDCVLEGNQAFGNGGGIAFIGGGANTLTIRDSIIQDNIGDSNVGGVWVLAFGQTSAVSVQFVGTTIRRNNLSSGGPVGGVAIGGGAGSTISFTDCSITDNVSRLGSAGGVSISLDGAGTVSFTGVVIARNHGIHGGGLGHSGAADLSITDCVFEDNTQAGAGNGGGASVFMSAVGNGSVTVTRSRFAGNSTTGLGGGMSVSVPNMSIIDSTFHGNTTPADGGGLYADNTPVLSISGSTFSANSAGRDGGGLYAPGSLTLQSTIANSSFSGNSAGNNAGGLLAFHNYTITHTTITANRADSDASGAGAGGGLQGVSSTLLHHTLIAGNFIGAGAAPGDIGGAVNKDGSYNLIGDETGMGSSNRLFDGLNGNQVGSSASPINPILGLLASNGGPTQTHALLSGSPALDAGNNAIVTVATDQRGQPRIDDSDDPGFTATVDIGAYEMIHNDAPTANIDPVTVAEDDTAVIRVLDNDSDPDGDPLTITAITDPAHGAAVIVGQGIITYQGDLNYFGSDSFTYSITDGNGHTATTVVEVTVTPINDAPVASDDSATTLEDNGVIVPVLLNDTDDSPGGSLSVSIASVMGASNGSLLVVDGDGDGAPDGILYTPNPNFHGVDSFTYRASDGSLLSNVATVTITVQAVNDSPFANADQYTVVAGSTLVVPAPGVLANDTDANGDALSARFFSPPSHGTLSLMRTDGSFAYTPHPGYVGPDSFEYEVSDPFGNIARARVSLDVTPPSQAYLDFGDAPDDPANPNDYPTLLASEGARHTALPIADVLFFGIDITAEFDGHPSLNADGDNDGGIRLGFADPTAPMAVPFVPGFKTPVLISVVGSGFVNAWFDWNGDHDWADEGEQVLTEFFVSNTTTFVPITVPETAVVGPTYARFRLSSTSGLKFVGPANDGEVEDYRLEIEPGALRIHQGDGTLTVIGRKLAGMSIADDGHGTITIVSGQFAESYRAVERILLDVASDIPLSYSLAPGLSGGARIDNVFADDSGEPHVESGDAPVTYGEATHYAIGPILGERWDNEAGALFGIAIADDVSGFDDEDGLRFHSIISVPGSTRVHATLQASRPGFSPGSEVGHLDAWIDWNHTGRFEQFEHLFNGLSPFVISGSVDVTLVGPETTFPDFLFARFRISPEGSLNPFDPSLPVPPFAYYGETEDYLIRDVSLHVVEDGSVLNVRAHGAGSVLLTDAGDGKVHLDAPDLPGSAAGWDFSGITLIHLDVGANDRVQFQYTGPPDAQRVQIQPIGIELADHGDAPTVFPRTGEPTAYGDAAHLFRGPQLGAARDSEFALQPDGEARGDDHASLDDEDGFDGENGLRILLSASSAFDMEGLVKVYVLGASDEGAVLDAWVDFNRDGVFDPEERLGGGAAIRVFNGENTLREVDGIPITVPAGTRPGETYARFRLSTAGGLGPTGLAADGEVEDYLVTIRPSEDFGDAPASYGTLLADDGPRHTNPNSPPSLAATGRGNDVESDGQPTDQADGDDFEDLTNLIFDDEDGVKLPILFSSSPYDSTAELVVEIRGTIGPVGTDGYLDAWIDFNRNGKFDHPLEHLGGGLSIPVNGHGSAPLPNVISFTVPGWAVPGTTFGRFRTSQAGGLLPTGPARTGEVEDHVVTILPRAHAVFVGNAGLLQVLGNAAADNLELVVNPLGQVQLFSIQEHGQRVAATIFDSRTGRPLDPFGRGWPTAANIRQVQVRLGDGDDVFYAAGALLKRLTIDGELGSDTVILRGTDQADILDVANAEVIDVHSAGGNDRVNVRFDQGLRADIGWTIRTGGGADSVTVNLIPPPDPDIPLGPLTVRMDIDGGTKNDRISVQAIYAFLAPLGSGAGSGPPHLLSELATFINIRGGAGNDAISAVMGVEPTPFLPNLVAEINVHGGTGNDTVSAQGFLRPGFDQAAGPLFEPPLVRMAFNVEGGAGKDKLVVQTTVDDTVPLEMEINLDGGVGQDTLTARAFLADPTPPPIASLMPMVVGLHLDGGAGRDRLSALAQTSDNLPAEVAIDADGGAGNDWLSARTIVLHGAQPMTATPGPVRMDVNLDGGAGGDILAVHGFVDPATLVGFNPQPEPPILRVNADGGAGHDAIDAVFRLTAPPSAPLLKSAELEASLLGGLGDDVFRVLWDQAAWNVLAFVDGGPGADNGAFAPGVEHESVETA